MESGVFELLLEHGSLGLFAAFLVYQHLNMQKRFDALIQNFQEQLEKIQSIQKSEINEIRIRYDKVLESYNDERTQIRINLAEKIAKVQNKIESLPFDNMGIQIEAVSLNQRNTLILLEKANETLNKIFDER